MVDKDFPAGTELTPLEREREAHLAFAEARRRVYIGGEDYFRQMDEFVSGGKDVPLVLLGESGERLHSSTLKIIGRLWFVSLLGFNIAFKHLRSYCDSACL